MTDEVEATSQPAAGGDKELGPAFVGERVEIENGVLKCFGVEGEAVSNGAELGDRNAVRPKESLRPAGASASLSHTPIRRCQQCNKHNNQLHHLHHISHRQSHLGL